MRSTGGDCAAARRWAPRSARATSAAPAATPAAIHGWMPGGDDRRDRGTCNRDALAASCGWSATSRLDPSRLVACAGSAVLDAAHARGDAARIWPATSRNAGLTGILHFEDGAEARLEGESAHSGHLAMRAARVTCCWRI